MPRTGPRASAWAPDHLHRHPEGVKLMKRGLRGSLAAAAYESEPAPEPGNASRLQNRNLRTSDHQQPLGSTTDAAHGCALLALGPAEPPHPPPPPPPPAPGGALLATSGWGLPDSELSFAPRSSSNLFFVFLTSPFNKDVT